MAGMTIRDIGILFGYELDKGSEQKVESSVQSLKSFATKALGAIGLTLSIKGIATAIKGCVSLASEVEEMENKFDVVFDNIREDVDAWAQEYSDAIGRNKNDIKAYLADQQNLLVGFGMTREAGAELSKQMTTLALDLASFANLDEATAVNAMSKAVMGNAESAKTLGAVLNDTTRQEAMLAMGLTGSYDKLDQLTKMQVNYEAIMRQSKDAVGDCERSLGSYQSTLKQFQSKLKELKTLVGQFFLPTFQRVLSFGTRGITMLRNAAQKISDFAAKVGGSEKIIRVLGVAIAATFAASNISKISKVVDAIKSFGKAAGVSSAKVIALFAVFLLLALLIEDFIAFMRGDDSLIGSLFEKAGIDAEQARQTILNAWEAVKNFLLKVWETIKSAAQAIFGALRAWWAENGEAVKESFSKIWEGIKTICLALWNALKVAAQTIFNALKRFWDTWGSTIITVFTIIWNTLISLIQPFLNALAALIDFLANVFTGNWEGAWESIKDYAAAIWEMITTVITAAWDIICAVWDKLAEIFGGIFQAAWDVITEKVTGIKNAIVDGFQAAIDWITALPAQAVQWGKDIIQGIVDGITQAASAVGDAVKGVADKIKSFLGFSEPEDGPLSDFHTYMPDMMDLMAEGISKGRQKVMDALGDVTEDMSVLAQADVVSPKTTGAVGGSVSNSRSIVQNVNISNQFNGDRAGQQKSSEAMERASGDATSQMARALAFAR